MKKIIFTLPLTLALVIACSHKNEQIKVSPENYVSEAASSHYRDNVVEKRRGPTFVSYEYRDVRIDELKPLAMRYCREKEPSMRAHLREIIMRENHSRLATFDCKSLQ